MKTKEEQALELDIDTLHREWEDRRAERDIQASIRLENLATWVLFKLADGGK